VVFEEITPFEEMDEAWLEGLIKTPQREKAKIKNPRSAMMLNPLKLKHLNRLDALDADIVVVNLEDGVAPQMKRRALLLASVFISNLKSSRSRVVVRVNPIDEGGAEEIRYLNPVRPDCIRVAKIRRPEDVQKVLSILDPGIGLHLSIETKEALSNLSKLNIEGRVETVSLGIMDMLHSLSLPQHLLSPENPTVRYLLARFLIESRIAGVYPIGFTYQEYEDLEGFRQWCLLEKQMGYTAKSCLGPRQVAIANEIFSPDPEIIARARYIKERFETMVKKGESGFMDQKYGFIDEPIYKDALLTLENYDKITQKQGRS